MYLESCLSSNTLRRELSHQYPLICLRRYVSIVATEKSAQTPSNMAESRGKQFEQVFRGCLDKVPQISVDRFADPMAGFKGIKNICDFSAYRYPYQFYFECKAYHENTLNFNSSISEYQWLGLSDKSQIPGVIAGIVVWFIDHDVTAFVPIRELVRLKAAGKKSLHVNDIHSKNVIAIPVPGVKKRVFFEYDGKLFLDDLVKTLMRGGS